MLTFLLFRHYLSAECVWSFRLEEFVSIHHRLPQDLRRRLKIAAAERDLKMTDIINQAITMWLDDEFPSQTNSVVSYGTISEAIEELRRSTPHDRHRLMRGVSKTRAIAIGKGLGLKTDPRYSQIAIFDKVLSSLAA
jgi:hypothetical protein